MSNLPPDLDPAVRAEAWIGDAVLALYVREWLLELNRGVMDGQLFMELTSNKFLRLVGNATAVEARIGTAYREGGLAAAYEFIRTQLRPYMDRHLAVRRRKMQQS